MEDEAIVDLEYLLLPLLPGADGTAHCTRYHAH